MLLRQGSVLGEYEIISPLGAGGMGEVYRALDLRLDREVAIKVLPNHFLSDPERLHRFEQEARAAATLNHPNVCVVYRMATWESVTYLVMELLEGETLRERMNRGPLPLRKAIEYAIQIAHGLQAAHSKGIIHRDLKPENLFITRDGRLKILDFGLARVIHPPGSMDSTMGGGTAAGILLGTVGYMSPEQVRGAVADQRSDIFSASVILREMLTGTATFQKPTSVETMTAILNEEPAPVPDSVPAPAALQRILHRGLEKDPEQRFHSASDLSFALEALSDPAISLPAPAQAHAWHGTKLQRAITIGIRLTSVSVLAVIVYLWPRQTAVPAVSNYVQLTHDGVQKTIIGTDGSRLYLNVVTSAIERVSAVSITGGDESEVPMPAPGMLPVALSADGSQFLVVEGKGVPFRGALWSVPVLGGSSRRLAKTVGSTGAWSADGELLAYADGGKLFVGRNDGTETRQILTMTNLIDTIAWSPDNSLLEIGTSQGFGASIGQHLLWEVSAGGAGLHRMFPSWHNPPDECCARWSADGKYLIFQSRGQIWTLARRGGIFHGTPQPILLTSSPMSLYTPVARKDGRKLFVVGSTFRGELTRYDFRTNQFVPFLDGVSAEYVSFSKDGQWVAYVKYPEGTLWRSRLDGSKRLQLTFAPLHAVLPRWSPDGRTLLFFEFPVSSTQPGHMYEVSADGGSSTELIPGDPHNQHDPNWSPEGTKIVFAGDGNEAASIPAAAAIRIFDVKTHRVTTVRGSEGLFSPRWSPDGRFLAALNHDSSALLLFNFATGKWTQAAQGTFGWLNWSRDGKSMYMLDFTGSGSVIKIGLADHRSERIADLKGFITTGQFGGALSLAPDDSPLLLRDRGTQDVYALDWSD